MPDEAILQVPLTAEGLAYISDSPEHAQELAMAARSFREFLNHWHFIDQDTGEDRILGHSLWPSQEQHVAYCEREALALWVYFLKARQLGQSTIECAFDGWVARFRDLRPRVHIFSKADDEAKELLERVKYGLENLPSWMQLPVLRDTEREYRIGLDAESRSILRAYATGKNPSRGATCNHAHIDEWAAMLDPKAAWAAIWPAAAKSIHLLTTGAGPQNYTGIFWKRAMAGDVTDRRGVSMATVFISATERPDRTETQVKAARLSGGVEAQRELAMTWQDALAGGGDLVFTDYECNMAAVDTRGFTQPTKGRKYVIAWDIGRHKDAAVGTVLDVTDEVYDVVGYKRLREHTYPMIQDEIERWHRMWKPTVTAIEKNSAGEAVLENLDLPEDRLEGFTTSRPSKLRIIQQTKLLLQGQLLKWNPEECQQLDAEMRGYQLPDDALVQDSVMSIAIAIEYADAGGPTGRVLGVRQV